MTTDTMKVSVRNTLTNLRDSFKLFKKKYCPDQVLCNDIATIGGLLFTVWFMWLAMRPLWTPGIG